MGNGHLLHLKLPALHSHDSHCDFLIKAPPAAASGIEPKDTVPFFTGVLMGMSVDYDIHAGQVCGYIPLVVNHKKVNTLNGECEAMGQVFRPLLVIVAPDDLQGSEASQGLHDGLCVDIAAVDNSIRAGEVVQHL